LTHVQGNRIHLDREGRAIGMANGLLVLMNRLALVESQGYSKVGSDSRKE